MIAILANPYSHWGTIFAASGTCRKRCGEPWMRSNSACFLAVGTPHCLYMYPARRGEVKHKIKGSALEIVQDTDFIAAICEAISFWWEIVARLFFRVGARVMQGNSPPRSVRYGR